MQSLKRSSDISPFSSSAPRPLVRLCFLNSLIKQTLGSLDLPSMLEPRGLYRTDGKRPDDVNMIPWEMGKQLVWMSRLWMLLHPVA